MFDLFGRCFPSYILIDLSWIVHQHCLSIGSTDKPQGLLINAIGALFSSHPPIIGNIAIVPHGVIVREVVMGQTHLRKDLDRQHVRG